MQPHAAATAFRWPSRQSRRRPATSLCFSRAVGVAQPERSLAALGRDVERHDDMALAALATAVKASGSLVIALALGAGRLDPAAAFEAAELDASHQIEAWGEDPEAAKRRATVMNDLGAARRFLDLLRA